MISSFRTTLSRPSVLIYAALAGVLFASPTTRGDTRQETEDDRAEARAMLNQGVEAYKNAKFDEAIADFKRAKELDPSLANAQLYLATAYASQYIPGVPTQGNLRYGELAIQEFRAILEKDPTNLSAIDGMGSILYNMGSSPFDTQKLEEAKSYHERHTQIQPADAEAYYWVGVIDWSVAYRSNIDLRNEYNRTSERAIKQTDPMPPALAVRFTERCGAIVDEGIAHIKKAIELRPDYDDAMAYLNLLYRQKADMETSPSSRENDIRMADELVDQAVAIKRKKAGASQPR